MNDGFGKKINDSSDKQKNVENKGETLNCSNSSNKTISISRPKNDKNDLSIVPNRKNYTQGGFAAVDDLGRELPDSSLVGIYGSKGEFYVGMFYFMWLGEHGDNGVFDINKIIKEYGENSKDLLCGGWGDVGDMHFWGEPLFGYYYSRDEWVIRQHIELLTNANIDFLYFDVTNGYPYISTAKKIMKVCSEFISQGFDAPKVVFYTHAKSKKVVKEVFDSIYKENYCPETWFIVDGKPVIVAYYEDNIDDFFSIRLSQWPNEPENEAPSWPWMDFELPQRVFKNNGVGESINVSVAQHSGSVRFSTSEFYNDCSNRGRSTVSVLEDKSKVTPDSYKEGRNFQAQWDRVFKCIEESKNDVTKNIKYVLVTGWNEWVAQRQTPNMFPGEDIIFIDTVTTEYSRDIEMTRGEYFDNYYLQLISNVSRLKGTAPIIINRLKKSIDLKNGFEQWNDVVLEYSVPTGNLYDRNELGFGKTTYINNTGRNEISSAKVVSDEENIYFFVETTENICEYDSESSFMQLFIISNRNSKKGWYGYDYIINYKVKDKETTTVAKNQIDGVYSFEIVSNVSYIVSENKMMIKVPLKTIGIEDCNNINLEFKWADSKKLINSMEDFYESGDSAPLGRLNWIYRNN